MPLADLCFVAFAFGVKSKKEKISVETDVKEFAACFLLGFL